jgi:dTDP-4-dehydrorhamnose 3,5-epimerase
LCQLIDMQITNTIIPGCYILQPQIFADDRGYFIETFNKNTFFNATGVPIDFVQDNESMSNYGVVRGLHFQTGDMAQAKLVRVVQGEVLDVVVDIRPDSPTFLQHFSIRLNAQNKTQLFVPIGCAHGFSVLQDQTIFNYKCSNFYSKAHESGLLLNDSLLNIDWQIPSNKMIISEKDLLLPNVQF